jgi:hypothetical protein
LWIVFADRVWGSRLVDLAQECLSALRADALAGAYDGFTVPPAKEMPFDGLPDARA